MVAEKDEQAKVRPTTKVEMNPDAADLLDGMDGCYAGRAAIGSRVEKVIPPESKRGTHSLDFDLP